jgi:hypothetical protein
MLHGKSQRRLKLVRDVHVEYWIQEHTIDGFIESSLGSDFWNFDNLHFPGAVFILPKCLQAVGLGYLSCSPTHSVASQQELVGHMGSNETIDPGDKHNGIERKSWSHYKNEYSTWRNKFENV